MTRYRLLVININQQKTIYEIDAPTLEDAITRAKQNGYIILKTMPSSSPVNSLQGIHFNKSKDVLLFIKNLSILLSSSLPLSDSLQFIIKNTNKTKFRKIIIQLYEHITEGLSLSEAMQKYPRFFTPTICAVVLAGEKSGHMDEAFIQLSNYLESRDEMNSSLRQALAYPLLLVVISMTVIILLMSIAIPGIAEQLTQSNIALPISTQIVITTSRFINHWWPQIIVGLLVSSIILRIILSIKSVQLKFHEKILTLPLLGTILKKTHTASVMMTLGILTQFSVPLMDAFKVSKEVITNLWLKKQLTNAYSNINEGSTIYHALIKAKILDNTTLALLSAGERSGSFPEMVTYATNMLRKEIKNQLATFIKLLEPILIFFVGFLVLFIFMSIMQPMLSLNNMVQ